MKFLWSAFALSLCTMAQGQITIDTGDMPQVGDTLRYFTSQVTGFNGADTGPGHVWDHSQLPLTIETADTAVSVGSTPLLYQFFFNNPFLYPDHDADYAVTGQAFGFGALTVSDVYDYFKNNSDGFRNVGFGANVNGLPSSVQRNPVDWIHHFPLEYGDADSSFSHFELNVPTLLYFGQDQWRVNEVDGWGTLYLPADTFEVLRVKSTLTRIDTVFIDAFGIGFTLPEPETVEYKWLAQGVRQPVLQINTIAGAPALTRFVHDLDISTGVAAVHVPSESSAYPNPADDFVFVPLAERTRGELLVLDASGREVVRQRIDAASPVVRVNVSGLANGTYTFQLAGGADRWSGRLVIDRP